MSEKRTMTQEVPSNTNYYDRYWDERSLERTRMRSRGRARLGLELLRQVRGEHSGSFLEVGCGPGFALEVFLQAGYQAQGLELSPRAVQMAQENDLPVECRDLEHEEIEKRFDVIACLEVLEHVHRPVQMIESLVNALSDDGVLLISLPNEWHFVSRIRGLLGVPSFGGHDDPHIKHFSVKDQLRLFEESQLELLSSAWDGLAPPRWPLIKTLTEPLAQFRPQLFALSGVHLLKPTQAGTVKKTREEA